MSRNQTHIADRSDLIHTSAACVLLWLLSKPQTLGARRDMEGPQSTWTDQGHVPRKRCRQEVSSPTAYRPHWKCWCPPSPPQPPGCPAHPPLAPKLFPSSLPCPPPPSASKAWARPASISQKKPGEAQGCCPRNPDERMAGWALFIFPVIRKSH